MAGDMEYIRKTYGVPAKRGRRHRIHRSARTEMEGHDSWCEWRLSAHPARRHPAHRQLPPNVELGLPHHRPGRRGDLRVRPKHGTPGIRLASLVPMQSRLQPTGRNVRPCPLMASRSTS